MGRVLGRFGRYIFVATGPWKGRTMFNPTSFHHMHALIRAISDDDMEIFDGTLLFTMSVVTSGMRLCAVDVSFPRLCSRLSRGVGAAAGVIFGRKQSYLPTNTQKLALTLT